MTGPDALGDGRASSTAAAPGRGRQSRKSSGLLVAPEQRLDPLAQGRVRGAGPVQERRPLGRVVPLQGLDEDGLFPHRSRLPVDRSTGLHLPMRHPGRNCARSGKLFYPGRGSSAYRGVIPSASRSQARA